MTKIDDIGEAHWLVGANDHDRCLIDLLKDIGKLDSLELKIDSGDHDGSQDTWDIPLSYQGWRDRLPISFLDSSSIIASLEQRILLRLARLKELGIE